MLRMLRSLRLSRSNHMFPRLQSLDIHELEHLVVLVVVVVEPNNGIIPRVAVDVRRGVILLLLLLLPLLLLLVLLFLLRSHHHLLLLFPRSHHHLLLLFPRSRLVLFFSLFSLLLNRHQPITSFAKAAAACVRHLLLSRHFPRL